MTDAADAAFMERAIVLARARRGSTAPNPAVGCVLVQDGRVIAQAATGEGGRPHAEEQALAAVGAAARGATAYVTLEPCGHRSSGAPSCSERLASAGVSKVIYACANPDPLSAGIGPRRLIEAGVKVQSGLMADEATERLYRGFFHRLATGVPLVEITVDGAGFDARFEPAMGESRRAALKRYARAGYAWLWTDVGGG